MDFRKVLISEKDGWHETIFSELKKGDTFMLFESDMKIVCDPDGRAVFYAVSDPYRNKNGVLTINTTSLKGGL